MFWRRSRFLLEHFQHYYRIAAYPIQNAPVHARNSWQFAPIVGIGRDSGIESRSPSCNMRNK